MFHYRVTITYKGTEYHGWQAQCAGTEEDEDLPTVQGTMYRVLRKIARYQDCSISGTSRTDAGVHAQRQVGKIRIPKEISAATLMRGMNSMLPNSIRILQCESCDAAFNPKGGCSHKEYHYYFHSGAVANPILADVVAHVPGPMDMKRLRAAAKLFEGKHDFYSFCSRSGNATTTTREVFSCTLEQGRLGPLAENVCYLRFVGNGFLKYMIRYLAATLFEIARGTLEVSQVQEYLSTHQDTKLCAKAPAHGLHLVAIDGV